MPGDLGYKSRTQGKGYGIIVRSYWEHIGNMLGLMGTYVEPYHGLLFPMCSHEVLVVFPST